MVPMNLVEELALLLRTTPVSYSRFVLSLLLMDAHASATKAAISLTTWKVMRELARSDRMRQAPRQ